MPSVHRNMESAARLQPRDGRKPVLRHRQTAANVANSGASTRKQKDAAIACVPDIPGSVAWSVKNAPASNSGHFFIVIPDEPFAPWKGSVQRTSSSQILGCTRTTALRALQHVMPTGLPGHRVRTGSCLPRRRLTVGAAGA